MPIINCARYSIKLSIKTDANETFAGVLWIRYMFSIRVEENATAEAESATGTSKLAPWPRFGSMILYGTSYQLPPPCSLEYTEMLGQKFPSSITCRKTF